MLFEHNSIKLKSPPLVYIFTLINKRTKFFRSIYNFCQIKFIQVWPQNIISNSNILKYKDIFMNLEKGQVNITTHRINTYDEHPPIKMSLGRYYMVQKQIIDKEIDKMLEGGATEPRNVHGPQTYVQLKRKMVYQDFEQTLEN